MARKTFFSFHYERDVWRAANVRSCNMISSDDEYGFVDKAAWESIKRQGDPAIEKWINDQLKNTSVTVVLIGAETAERDWVDYEIRQSWKKGNGLVGVRIHIVRDQNKQTDAPGPNPFDRVLLVDGIPLSEYVDVYDFVDDNGRENMGSWIEDAFQFRQSYQGETRLKEGNMTAPAFAAAPTVINAPAKPWAR